MKNRLIIVKVQKIGKIFKNTHKSLEKKDSIKKSAQERTPKSK